MCQPTKIIDGMSSCQEPQLSACAGWLGSRCDNSASGPCDNQVLLIHGEQRMDPPAGSAYGFGSHVDLDG